MLQKTWNVLGNKGLILYKTSQISQFIHHSKGNIIHFKKLSHWINLWLKFKSLLLCPKKLGEILNLKNVLGANVASEWCKPNQTAKHFSDYCRAIPHAEFFLNTPDVENSHQYLERSRDYRLRMIIGCKIRCTVRTRLTVEIGIR